MVSLDRRSAAVTIMSVGQKQLVSSIATCLPDNVVPRSVTHCVSILNKPSILEEQDGGARGPCVRPSGYGPAFLGRIRINSKDFETLYKEVEYTERLSKRIPPQDDATTCNAHHDSEEDGGEGGHGNGAATDHCHYQRSGKQASRRAMSRLIIAACLTTIFMIAEIVGGYLANSIAIMSDAAHLLSDLTSFLVSLGAIYLALRAPSKKMSFGYHRAEVLGALMSVLIIWVITGILVYAAVERVISMDFEVEADTMIIISALGVVINIILGVVLHAGGGHGHSHGGFSGHNHSHGHSHSGGNQNSSTSTSGTAGENANNPNRNLNIRAAFIHVIGDLIQSIGVLIAAYVIRYYPEYKIADPICTFIFSVLVVFTTVPILRDLSHILMEGAPPGVDYSALTTNLAAISGVKMVHSLHIWTLTMDKNAASVHLAIDSNSDPEVILQDAQRVMRLRHHTFHTTIQVERYEAQLMDNCQQCQPLSRM
ncbi:unnamed protein product, partial [Meganyctiphanes norvegica]